MRKILMAAATVALFTAPALAADHTPQTNSSGPGSTGTTQQQDMNRSNMKSDQMKSDENAQAPGAQPMDKGGINTENGSGSSGASGSMNPQQNPRSMRKEK